MGVKGLWTLLEASGRRVDIATLRGKTLAVDVSIWLTQFVKAMRDENTGMMRRNAHLLGMIRRIIKLLFHRIRPVFVFDGGAPVLKRKTVLKRQAGRVTKNDQHEHLMRRLLINQLQKQQLANAAGAGASSSSSASTSQAAQFVNKLSSEQVSAAVARLTAQKHSKGHSLGGKSPGSSPTKGGKRRSAGSMAAAAALARSTAAASASVSVSAAGKLPASGASGPANSAGDDGDDVLLLDTDDEHAGEGDDDGGSQAAELQRALAMSLDDASEDVTALDIDDDDDDTAVEDDDSAHELRRALAMSLGGGASQATDIEDDDNTDDVVIATSARTRGAAQPAVADADRDVDSGSDSDAAPPLRASPEGGAKRKRLQKGVVAPAAASSGAAASSASSSAQREPLGVGAGAGASSSSSSSARATYSAAAASASEEGAGGSDSDESAIAAIYSEVYIPVVPESAGEADLSVLSSLPAHMQKEYVEAMRRRQRNANQRALLGIGGDAPAAFSRAQIAAFIGLARFNKDVDGVNAAQAAAARAQLLEAGEAAAGGSNGEGGTLMSGGAGLAGRRIASEANREYVLIRDSAASGDGAATRRALMAAAGLGDATQSPSGSPTGEAVGGAGAEDDGDEGGGFISAPSDAVPPAAGRSESASSSGAGGGGPTADSTTDFSDRDKLQQFLAYARPAGGRGGGSKGAPYRQGQQQQQQAGAEQGFMAGEGGRGGYRGRGRGRGGRSKVGERAKAGDRDTRALLDYIEGRSARVAGGAFTAAYDRLSAQACGGAAGSSVGGLAVATGAYRAGSASAPGDEEAEATALSEEVPEELFPPEEPGAASTAGAGDDGGGGGLYTGDDDGGYGAVDSAYGAYGGDGNDDPHAELLRLAFGDAAAPPLPAPLRRQPPRASPQASPSPIQSPVPPASPLPPAPCAPASPPAASDARIAGDDEVIVVMPPSPPVQEAVAGASAGTPLDVNVGVADESGDVGSDDDSIAGGGFLLPGDEVAAVAAAAAASVGFEEEDDRPDMWAVYRGPPRAGVTASAAAEAAIDGAAANNAATIEVQPSPNRDFQIEHENGSGASIASGAATVRPCDGGRMDIDDEGEAKDDEWEDADEGIETVTAAAALASGGTGDLVAAAVPGAHSPAMAVEVESEVELELEEGDGLVGLTREQLAARIAAMQADADAEVDAEEGRHEQGQEDDDEWQDAGARFDAPPSETADQVLLVDDDSDDPGTRRGHVAAPALSFTARAPAPSSRPVSASSSGSSAVEILSSSDDGPTANTTADDWAPEAAFHALRPPEGTAAGDGGGGGGGVAAAYEVAANMRGWAKHAFARALKSHGMQVPSSLAAASASSSAAPATAATSSQHQLAASAAAASSQQAVQLSAAPQAGAVTMDIEDDAEAEPTSSRDAGPTPPSSGDRGTGGRVTFARASALLESLAYQPPSPSAQSGLAAAAASVAASTAAAASGGFSAVSRPLQPGEAAGTSSSSSSSGEAYSRALDALHSDEAAIRSQASKAMRDSDVVTETMRTEVMEMLALFGLPFVVAPMEAEAQCAALEEAGLVDGVISDDSDTFLFGGTAIYRHIFDDSKYVEAYLMRDISRELGYAREDLVRAALLLGSDYTEGVDGVGPVNATEVLAVFRGERGLVEFKEWLSSTEPDVKPGAAAKKKGKGGKGTPPKKGKKKGKKAKKGDDNDDEGQDDEEVDIVEEDEEEHDGTGADGSAAQGAGTDPAADALAVRRAEFKWRHRNARRKWVVPESFPSRAVIEAYLKPMVTHFDAPPDNSDGEDEEDEGGASRARRKASQRGKYQFLFRSPDFDALRSFCGARLGWDAGECGRQLGPLMRELSSGVVQGTLDRFVSRSYADNDRAATIASSRLQAAVRGMSGKPLGSALAAGGAGGKRKRKAPAPAGGTPAGRKKKRRAPGSDEDGDDDDDGAGDGGVLDICNEEDEEDYGDEGFAAPSYSQAAAAGDAASAGALDLSWDIPDEDLLAIDDSDIVASAAAGAQGGTAGAATAGRPARKAAEAGAVARKAAANAADAESSSSSGSDSHGAGSEGDSDEDAGFARKPKGRRGRGGNFGSARARGGATASRGRGGAGGLTKRDGHGARGPGKGT